MTDVLDDAATGKGLVASFQRVVSLPSETTVGYEAPARWPSVKGATPNRVFAHAQRMGTLDVLDHECIRVAAQGALDGRSAPGMLLLINCEPTTTSVDLATETALAEAADNFRLGFELTERGLLENPQMLIRKVAALREQGVTIALDDIGAHHDSLALFDIIEPDILKLDLGLIQRQPNAIQARTVAAVIAHHERTGALIIAEGIETNDHLEQALAYGATFGQGFRFGSPGELSAPLDGDPLPPWQAPSPSPFGPSAFDLATAGLSLRTVRKRTLLELSHHIERLALTAESPPIVLATVQKHVNFRGGTRDTYAAIAERSPLVAIFGEDRPDTGSRVRGVSLAPDDPLSREWTIVVLGPDTAAGLIAREHIQTVGASDRERRFDMVITFDRGRVATAARSLMDRLNGAGIAAVR